MIRAFNKDYVEEYSLKDDTEPKTIFTIGVLNAFVRAHIDDAHYSVDPVTNINDTRISDKYIDFVRFGLRGWSNFKDASGKDIEFKTEEKIINGLGKVQVVSDDCLNKLQLKELIELGFRIVTMNSVSEQDAKN